LGRYSLSLSHQRFKYFLKKPSLSFMRVKHILGVPQKFNKVLIMSHKLALYENIFLGEKIESRDFSQQKHNNKQTKMTLKCFSFFIIAVVVVVEMRARKGEEKLNSKIIPFILNEELQLTHFFVKNLKTNYLTLTPSLSQSLYVA